MPVEATSASKWAPPVDARVVELVAGIEAGLDELQAVPVGSMNESTQQALVEALPGLAARFDATITTLLGQADASCMAQRRRYRHLAQMLMAKTNVAGREIRARLRLATWLRDFSDFAEAYRRGELTTDHLDKIRRGLDNGRTHGLLRRDQQVLIDAARDCSFKDFERVCDYWKIAADPDGEEPRAQLDKSHVRARRRADGMVEGSFLLDPVSGQVLLTAWQNRLQRLARARADGEPIDERVLGVQSFLQLIIAGAARADGSQPDPLVHLVMSLKVAEDTMRRLAHNDGSPLPVDADDVDGRCELIDGTPVHPWLAIAVLGIASLQRVVMTAKSHPLERSYKTRGFPKDLKHILMLRSRGRCEADGCDAPLPWLQADHVHPHSKGGETHYLNGKIYCRPDNLAKGDR